MQIVTVLSRKGGTGKSTTAIHLATVAAMAGLKVGLIDLDPQGSTSRWGLRRGTLTPTVLPMSEAEFANFASGRRRDADLMVVDTAPAAQVNVGAARAADLCLIVVRPNIFDVEAVEATADMVRACGRPGLFVVSQAPPARMGFETPATRQALETLKSYGLPVAPVSLRSRSAYSAGLPTGVTALESDPGGKAAREVEALWRAIRAELAHRAEALAGAA